MQPVSLPNISNVQAAASSLPSAAAGQLASLFAEAFQSRLNVSNGIGKIPAPGKARPPIAVDTGESHANLAAIVTSPQNFPVIPVDTNKGNNATGMPASEVPAQQQILEAPADYFHNAIPEQLIPTGLTPWNGVANDGKPVGATNSGTGIRTGIANTEPINVQGDGTNSNGPLSVVALLASGRNQNFQSAVNIPDEVRTPSQPLSQPQLRFDQGFDQAAQAVQSFTTAKGAPTAGGTAKDAAKLGQNVVSNERVNPPNSPLSGNQQNYNQLPALPLVSQSIAAASASLAPQSSPIPDAKFVNGPTTRVVRPQTDLNFPQTPVFSPFDGNPNPLSGDDIPVQDIVGNVPPVSGAQSPSAADTANTTNTANGSGQTDQTTATNFAAAAYLQAIQSAPAGFEFLSVRTASGTASAGNTPALSPRDFNLKDLVSTTTTPIVTTAQPGAMPVGASMQTPAPHNVSQEQAADVTPAAPISFAAAKPGPKDSSNGSQSNNSNSKPDNPAIPVLGSADAKMLVQSAGLASTIVTNLHAAPTDGSVPPIAVQIPVTTPVPSADSKPASSGDAPATLGQPTTTSTSASTSTSTSASAGQHPLVNGAQLTDLPGQTEMRIEMNAGPLGVVELRAHISGDQVGASIAVEHHDTQMMLTNDLQVLRSALVEKNVHIDSLSVSHGTSSSMDASTGGQSGQRGFTPYHSGQMSAQQEENSIEVQDAVVESASANTANSGLSVLA